MKYKIFVSGVQKELKEERHSIKHFIENNALLSEHFSVYLFEKDNPSMSKSPETAYIQKVGDSDIYLGMIGYEYGNAKGKELSATEKEYRKAVDLNKEILFYIKGQNSRNDLKRDKRTQNLIKEIRDSSKGYCCNRFNSIEELQNQVQDSLILFLKEKGVIRKTTFEKVECEESDFNDIDTDKIKWFLKQAKKVRKYSLDVNSDVKTVLTHLNILQGGNLTNAAILLFGKDPQKYLPQAQIKCLYVSGVEIKKPFKSFQPYGGNLFNQIDKATIFVMDSVRNALVQQKGTVQVKRVSEIPEFVIHEAIVNAIAHRDYNSSAGVHVNVFADRIEISNSGSLPSQLSLDDLKVPHSSFATNPLIANVLYLSDYIQGAGSGTIEMIEQSKKAGLPEPVFELKRNVEFKAIIPRDILTEKTMNELDLNERQKLAVKYLKENGKISNDKYKELCSTTKRTASRDLADLLKKGVLEKIGTTGKGTLYIVRSMGSQRGQRGHLWGIEKSCIWNQVGTKLG